MIQLPSLLKRFATLVRQPVFISLAIFGNSIILLGAVGLYVLENGENPKIHGFLDTLWWSVATVTTVGYGDVSPMTTPGKIMGIGMMLMGTTLFCSFTALFAATLLSGELEAVERDVKALEKEMHSDEENLDHHLLQIETVLTKMKALRSKQNK